MQKSIDSFVCNVNKNAYFSIINNRIIICPSGERARHPLKTYIFLKNLQNFGSNFQKTLHISIKIHIPSLLTVE